jgi:hypothetical protein
MLLFGCAPDVKGEIKSLLKSDKPDDLVKAFYLIGEAKDTSYIKIILTDIYDPRIAHDVEFKGISVYQSKITAIEKIIDLRSPMKVTYKPDTSVVQFYCEWMKKNMNYECDIK